MKYYKSNSFAKAIGSTGFVSIAACVLIAVGAISWFALSRNNSNKINQNSSNDSNQSYIEENQSYNDNTSVVESAPQPVTDVNESVSDIPYVQEPSDENEIETFKFVMPIEGDISKEFSDKALQYSATYNDMRLHTGIDILCELGSQVKSAGAGTVKSIVDDANYGKIVTIDHTVELTVKYCGLKDITVKEGDYINAGDVIGVTGEIPCECADEPHLHIEAFVQNIPASPLEALNLK